MKTLFFTGITATGFQYSLMLVNASIPCETDYSYGAVQITFDLKYRKEIGLALRRTFKRKNFKQTLDPKLFLC